MRLDNEVRLDFKDVLIVPKRSTLSSRADVSLIREYDFRYSKHPYKGIPILASNMDTVGTIEMAEALHPFKLGVCLHKFIELDKLADHFNSSTSEYSWFSMGITDTDLLKWQSLLKKCNPIRVCIDVANGYQEQFVSFVKKMRDSYPDITIMAGNVVTGDMVQALILADAVLNVDDEVPHVERAEVLEEGARDLRPRALLGAMNARAEAAAAVAQLAPTPA